MKKSLLIFCLFSTSAAFGQYYATHLDAQPQVYHAPDHPAYATYAPMRQERGITGGGTTLYAQGERPASDFPQAATVPLGDTARELKKQHALVKKARVVWEN